MEDDISFWTLFRHRDIQTTVEHLDVDAIPIHHQWFPRPQLDDRENGTRGEGESTGDHTGVPGTQKRELSYVLLEIRNLHTVVGWFKSKSEEPLLAPPEGLSPDESDVYVHQCGQCVQIWILVNGQWQGGIRDGNHHPTLPDYQLYMWEGHEPTWVTRKTRITYQGHAKSKRHLSPLSSKTHKINTHTQSNEIGHTH
ncbi:hypothetical protein V8E55_011729 [Tylopilus felleus]